MPPTATSEIPSIPRVAAAFPQLEIVELVGRGGMGFVFKARQPHLDRLVALKLLPDKLAKDPRFAERFNREGRVLAKLNHPNIVAVYDFGQTEHFYFLLMEFVDGVNLRQAMKAGRFSPGEALAIVPKICEALQYAHGQGILHRDIKPENILLDARGQVKIADFGIAKLVGEEKSDVTLTATGAALGTPHYMAPEQLEKPSEVDHRADIYSLGVVFYEMLTGELPIGRFAAPSSKTPVGAAVDEVVFRTLEKDRERRFQSAGEMKTQVEHLTDPSAPGGGTAAASQQGGVVGARGTQVIPDVSAARRPAKGLIVAGVLNWIGSIVVMLVLSYVAAGEDSALSPVKLGVIALLMIGMSSLILLAGLKMLKAQNYPFVVLGCILAMITTPGNIVGLPIGLWALVALRQPKVRAAFQAERATRGGSVEWSHAMTAALVAGILVCAMTLIPWEESREAKQSALLESTLVHSTAVPEAGPLVVSFQTNLEPFVLSEAEVAPKIQFTFTAVELQQEGDANWMAMDYVEQVRGNCERTFRYDARVPGFTAQTRITSSTSKGEAGFEAVHHQRAMWKLPESLPREEREALRDLLRREWISKSAVIEPGDERVLFKTIVPSGGTLAVAIGVKELEKAATRLAERLDSLVKREQELSVQYAADHPVLRELRSQIAQAQQELERLNRSQ